MKNRGKILFIVLPLLLEAFGFYNFFTFGQEAYNWLNVIPVDSVAAVIGFIILFLGIGVIEMFLLFGLLSLPLIFWYAYQHIENGKSSLVW